MGQLEKYGLYVLVVVIVLILGVAIWGDEPAVSRAELAKMQTNGARAEGDGSGVRGPGRYDRIERPDAFVPAGSSDRGGDDDPAAYEGTDRNRGSAGNDAPSPSFDDEDPQAGNGPGIGLGDPEDLVAQDPQDDPRRSDAEEPRNEPEGPREIEYVLAEGETLGVVARRFLGSSSRWGEIARWNGIEDERRVRAGQALVIKLDGDSAAGGNTRSSGGGTNGRQALEASGRRPEGSAGRREYTVRSGDSLSAIAAREMGSSRPSYVEALKAANDLRSDVIRVDDTLIIPPAPRD